MDILLPGELSWDVADHWEELWVRGEIRPSTLLRKVEIRLEGVLRWCFDFPAGSQVCSGPVPFAAALRRQNSEAGNDWNLEISVQDQDGAEASEGHRIRPLTNRRAAVLTARTHDLPWRSSWPEVILHPEHLTFEATGHAILRGWALSKSPIKTIRVSGPKSSSNHATIGLDRDDVARCYPEYPNSSRSGFGIELHTDRYNLSDMVHIHLETREVKVSALFPMNLVAQHVVASASSLSVTIECERVFLHKKGFLFASGWAVAKS